MCINATSPSTTPDESDRPPEADGGPDQVVQPQDTVMLNGMRSSDDKEIVSFVWQMITPYPYAVTEVGETEPDLNLGLLRDHFGVNLRKKRTTEKTLLS